MKLLEKLGITDNNGTTAESMANDINAIQKITTDFLPNDSSRITLAVMREFLNNHLSKRIVSVKHDEDSNAVAVLFKLNEKMNTCIWLDNDSDICLTLTPCTYAHYLALAKNPEFLNSSAYDINKNREITGHFHFAYFYIYDENKWITSNNSESIEPYIQHELNHIHKKSKLNRNNAAYSEILRMFGMRGISAMIARAIYMASFDDKRNAYVEQFYKEVKDKDPAMSDTFNELCEYEELMRMLKNSEYAQKRSIYLKFNKIVSAIYGINIQDENAFAEKFIIRLENDIALLKSRMLRTLSLYETHMEKMIYDGVAF